MPAVSALNAGSFVERMRLAPRTLGQQRLERHGSGKNALRRPQRRTGDATEIPAATRAIDNQPGKVVLVGHSIETLSIDLPKAPGTDHIVADASGWLSLPPADVAKYFAQDVPARQARVMAATQGPIKGTAFGEKVSVAAWHQKPSWFVISQNDRMINPEAQRIMARQIGAKVTELPTSHVPQQSRPADVAKVALDAVASVK